MQNTMFMIMPFNDEIANSIFTHSTKLICESYDLNVVRADEIFTTNPILDDIVMAIEEATIIMADVSGKNANVFYELGMAHMLKRSNTIMITHDKFNEMPFDIAHFRIIGYTDSIKGKAKYEKELNSTIKTILKDYQLINKKEFDIVIDILIHSQKETELYYILAIFKSNKLVMINDKVHVEGHNSVSNSSGSASSISAISATKPFISREYFNIVGEKLVISEKGKALALYLESCGYVLDKFNEQVFTKDYIPFFERLKKSQTED